MADYTLQEVGDLLNFTLSNTDTAALDSLSEIVAAFQGADVVINQTIADNLVDVNNSISALSIDIRNKIGDVTVDGTLGNTITDRIATALTYAKAYTDTREPLIILDAQAYADQSELDAIAAANLYTDTALTAFATTTNAAIAAATLASTDELPEGVTNLYYTDERVLNALGGSAEFVRPADLTSAIGQELTSSDPDVIAHSSFDELAGSVNFIDEVSGTPWTVVNETVISALNSIDGNSLDTDARADYASLVLPTPFLVDTTSSTDFTIEAWVTIVSTVSGSNQEGIRTINTRASDGASTFFSSYILNGSTTWCIYDDRWKSGYGTFNFGSYSAGLNNIRHVAMVKEGDRLSTYVNGVRSATITGTGATPQYITTIRLGQNAMTFYDELRMTRGAKYTGTSYTVPTAPLPAFSTETNVVSLTQAYTDTAVADLSASLTTDVVPEGTTNLYYTDAKVGSYLTTNSYATQSYVSTAIGNIPPTDLSSYYTSLQTDTAISTAIGNMPAVDFTGYATETYVGDAVTAQAGVTLLQAQQYADGIVFDLTGYATENYVDTAIGNIPATDLSSYYTSTETDTAISTAIGNIDYATTTDVSDLSGTYVAQTSLQALPATGAALYAAANTLYLQHADGTEDTVDLSVYMDDSNLAYIQSGSLDNTTGVVTFTRNDTSTFDIDMSALLDLELPRIDSAAFDDTTGILTLARLADDSSVTVSLDGRYLTGYTETDPVFTGSPAGGITTADISNWNTAHGWGDHSTVGYMMPTDKAADSNLLDGYDSSQFLGPVTGVLPQATLSVKPAEGIAYAEQRFHITDSTNGDSLSRIYYDGGRMYIQAGAVNDGATQSSGNLLVSGYYGTDIGSFQVRKGGINRDVIDSSTIGNYLPDLSSYLSLNASNVLELPKSMWIAGTNPYDLQIYTENNNAYVRHANGAGALRLDGNLIELRSTNSLERYLVATQDAGVELFHNDVLTLATTSTGVNVTGTFEASGDLVAYSDARLKTDVETISGALDIVQNLRGVCYIKDGHESVGVIAQEVEEVLPQVVHDSQWTGYKSVAYGNMVGVLIEAIKEQQTQIEALREEIKQLKG